MSGIFGIFYRDGSPVPRSTLETMRREMAERGPDGSDLWQEGVAGLGQARSFITPESQFERLPRMEATNGMVFTAAGRVDNRAELGSALNIPLSEEAQVPDSEFILRAYYRWGEDTPDRIYGDWAFAVWHPEERRLFVARDHHGNTALYYYSDPRLFAFASDQKALLALNLATMQMDELYLAQVMVSWPAYHGERTILTPIRRLPPSHCLSITPERVNVRRYWWLEHTPELHLPHRDDYVAAFREVFDEAVRSRLRSLDHVAVTLSGGLDSGSVTATAAGLLRQEGKRLTAFTSVPLSDTSAYVGKRFGDELPFAQNTARKAGNLDLYTIPATAISPLQAIRRWLEITGEPGHAAGNFFWILDLLQTARAKGHRVLLTGQMGNGSISWDGDAFSQPLAFQLRHLGVRTWSKERLKRSAPSALRSLWRGRIGNRERCRSSAIHPDFALRLRLWERLGRDPNQIGWRPPPESSAVASSCRDFPLPVRCGRIWERLIVWRCEILPRMPESWHSLCPCRTGSSWIRNRGWIAC